MKFQGEHLIKKPRTEVWAAVVDPRSLVSGLPGFQRLDPIGDHEYEGAFEVSAGDVRSDFQGTLELSDLKSPASFRFSLNAMGAAGFVDGSGMVVLEDAGGGTKIHYDLDAKIRGRIAAVGERALDESIRDVARQALENLNRQEVPKVPATAPPPSRPEPDEPTVDGGPEEVRADDVASSEIAAHEPAAEPPEPNEPAIEPPAAAPLVVETAGPAPTHRAQYASAATRGFGSDLLSSDKRPWLFGAALVAYTIAVVLLTRACSG